MNTNHIKISKGRAYLIPFVHTVLKKEKKENIIFANSLLDLLKLLVRTAPADYYHTLNEPAFSISFELPNWKGINTQYRFYLTHTAGRVIENYIYKMFNLILDMHIQHFSKYTNRKEAIFLFMEIYHIDFKYFETFNKKIYRKKLRIISQKSQKIASAFSVLLSFAYPLLSFIVF